MRGLGGNNHSAKRGDAFNIRAFDPPCTLKVNGSAIRAAISDELMVGRYHGVLDFL